MAVRARGYLVWVWAVSALACGGRSLVLDESSSGGSGSVTTEPTRPIADAGVPAPTHHGTDAGDAGARDAGVVSLGHDDAGDAGGDAPPDGGELADASDFADAAGPSEPFDAGDPSWNTKDVVNPLPDQGPESSSCGQCAANEVCHPNVGCEPACDIPTGLDPNAAWPIGGGCATRRGLSRYSGLKKPKLAFSLALGGSNADYSSAITLGENREIYVAGTAAQAGFLRIDRDGSGSFYPDWLGEVPLLGQNGMLYTVPLGLQATRRDGSALWSLRSGFGFPGPHDQEGEPVIGADGTIYSVGDFDDDTGLFAVSPAGQILWSVRTNTNTGMSTWPAIAQDGTIYFGAGDGALWAVSRGGKPLWHISAGDYVWGFPALDHAQNIYLGNGTHLWSLTPGGQTRWERSMTVASNEQFVFRHVAIGPDGTVFAPFIDQDSGSYESGVRAYTTDGTLRWSYQAAVYGVSTPVVDRDGILYLTTTNTLHAFSPSDGELWSTQIPFEDDCASVVLGADGTTFVKCGESLYGFRESSP